MALTPRSVLLVEDHEATRVGLVRLLTAKGLRVDAATSVAEALGTLDGQDAVILDWNLPDGTAGDVLNWMAQHGLRKPVVIFSASGDCYASLEELPVRPQAVYTKPSHLSALLQWVEAIKDENEGHQLEA